MQLPTTPETSPEESDDQNISSQPTGAVNKKKQPRLAPPPLNPPTAYLNSESFEFSYNAFTHCLYYMFIFVWYIVQMNHFLH